MNGLANELAGQPQQAMQPQQAPQQGMPTVEQVIELLMQGADPEELVAQGVPPELIMEAIAIIEQQMGAQQQQAPQQAPVNQEAGLAQSMMG